MKVLPYSQSYRHEWDHFIENSKNGVFLYCRDYMGYHSDRFEDHSLIFLDETEKIIALLPANIQNDCLISHGGLTFGGVVSDTRMTTPRMLDVFSYLMGYLKERGIRTLRYKAVPHIYHAVPAEEDLYALFVHGAKLLKREVTSTVNMASRLRFAKGRKCSISKAKKTGVEVRGTTDFVSFMKIEEEVLRTRHDTKPVHSAEEMALLASRFPQNIRLFGAFLHGEMCAGVIMFSGPHVAHVQYMAADEVGRECGALDLIIDHLINEFFANTRFFDFGISTENGGSFLNKGLIAQKEMFGARAVVHDTLELSV